MEIYNRFINSKHFIFILLFAVIIFWGYRVTATFDTSIYRCYAEGFIHGGMILKTDPRYTWCAYLIGNETVHNTPYLPSEYPLLALFPFLLPLLIPFLPYADGFAIITFMIMLSVSISFYYIRRRNAAVILPFYLILGSFGTALARFDIFPSILVLLTIILVMHKRFRWAYATLAIATMMKLYPIYLLLPLFIAEQQTVNNWKNNGNRLQGIVLFVSICITTFIISFSINAASSLQVFNYFLKRPFEVESIPASILWLSSFFGMAIKIGTQYRSVNIYEYAYNVATYPLGYYGMLTQIISVVFTLISFIGFILIIWLQVKRKFSFVHTCLGILLLILITNKVFSPQFLLWVHPLIAYLYGFQKKWVISWSIVGILTTIDYPFLFGSTPFHGNEIGSPLFFVIIAIRNLLLILLTIGYFVNFRNLRSQVKITNNYE